jgi:hypothetical protein
MPVPSAVISVPTALDVEDFSSQGQDRLVLAVAALLGRAAGRVALDDEQFRQRWILFLAIGQLAGQAGDIQRALAAGQVAGLARSLARARRVDDLAGDGTGLVRVFLQELLQTCTERALNNRPDLGTDQLFLGLRGKARVRHLDRQHRDHAFAHIVAGQRHLRLLGDAALLDVVAQRAGQRGAETDQVGTAVLLRNIVGEAEHRFLIGIGPLQGDVDGNAVHFAGHRDDIRVQRRLQLRQVLDEGADATFVLEHILADILAAGAAALIDQRDLDAGIEERQFAQPLRQDVVVELDVAEDLHRRLEAQQGAALVRSFELLERIQRLAERVFLLVVIAIAPDFQPQVLGKCIDHRHANAMQAAGNFIAVVVELTAGMQHGHDDFGCGDAFFLVNIDRDTASVVGYSNRAVFENLDDHIVGVPGQRFVDGVVHHLEHHVMQAGAVVDVADVHARALAHRLEAAQDGDFAGIVIAVRYRNRFVGHSLQSAA